MYTYFQERYHFKSIVLLRHPFAIAASSLGFGSNYDWHKKNYSKWSYGHPPESGDFFNYYDDKYNLITSPFTLLVFQAVTQFSHILKNFDTENSMLVFYEDLVLKPEEVKNQFENFFGENFSEDVFLKQLSKGSFSSAKGHTEQNKMKQISKWKQKVSDDDIKDGMKIFKAFDFEPYTDSVLPNKLS